MFVVAMCGFHGFYGFHAVSMVSILRFRFLWFPLTIYMPSVFLWFLWFPLAIGFAYVLCTVSVVSCTVSFFHKHHRLFGFILSFMISSGTCAYVLLFWYVLRGDINITTTTTTPAAAATACAN